MGIEVGLRRREVPELAPSWTLVGASQDSLFASGKLQPLVYKVLAIFTEGFKIKLDYK